MVVMMFLDDDGLQLAFQLGKLRKTNLSQKQYLLVREYDHLFRACEDSSYQHGLAFYATTKPSLP
jgi:hypothetical protein